MQTVEKEINVEIKEEESGKAEEKASYVRKVASGFEIRTSSGKVSTFREEKARCVLF